MKDELVKIDFEISPEIIITDRICRVYGSEIQYLGHSHNLYEIFFVTNGKCNFFAQNSFYTLNENDIILISPNQIHSITYPDSLHEHVFVNFSDYYINPEISHELLYMMGAGKYTPSPEDIDFFKNAFNELKNSPHSNTNYKARTKFVSLLLRIPKAYLCTLTM